MPRVRRIRPQVEIDEDGVPWVDGVPHAQDEAGHWVPLWQEERPEREFVTRRDLEHLQQTGMDLATADAFEAAFAEYEDATGRQLSQWERRTVVEQATKTAHDGGLAHAITASLLGLALETAEEENTAWDEAFQEALPRLERDLGRALTDREIKELQDELPQETEGEFDLKAAWESGPGRDGGRFDLDTHDGLTAWAAERAADAERKRAENPPEAKPEPPQFEHVHEWMEYGAGRMNGTIPAPGEVAEPEPAEPEAA